MFIIVSIFLFTPLFGQTTMTDSSEKKAENSEEFRDLPNGYRNVLLGMPLEQVKTALITESRFDYRGEPDVSLQDMGKRFLISCKGRGFIHEAFFQFNEKLLYLIIINFDKEKLDFFTLQQDLNSKFGPPSDLSPEGMTWENEKIILSLEYPVTLKYLDKKTFDGFIEDARSRDGFTEISRQEFLKDF